MPKGERRLLGTAGTHFIKGSRGLQSTAQIDTKEVRSQKSDRLQSPVSDNRNSR